MATLAPDSPSIPPPFHRRRKSWARRIERVCCQTFSYFPLLFVYGLTSWAVWVEVSVSLLGKQVGGLGYFKAGLGILLYVLADVSYTIAVFTDPGSPLDPRRNAGGRRKGGGYEGLPTHEDEEAAVPHGMSTVTAKSSGKQRYCKKCQSVKPDRSHHCSTCGKCVLKMDHHCPWLATCAGLRNYKPFLLFLFYISLFCWVCFGVSASWVWDELLDQAQMDEGLRVVNTIMLAVLGGIIGLVLSGFTGWHIYLALTGQTTIESLEKTRYLSPIRKNMESQLHAQSQRHYLGDEPASSDSNPNDHEEQTLTEHLKEIHANALPGVLRPEEGETPLASSPAPPNEPPWRPSWQSHSPSPAKSSLQRSYASLEAQREQDRYATYLDELDSEKMPNAFDMGWKRNLVHVLGENPWLWALPICNTTGDGWMWEISPKWQAARNELAAQRARSWRQAPAAVPQSNGMRWQPGQGFMDTTRAEPPPRGYSEQERQGGGVQMQPLDRRKAAESPDNYDTSSDEERQQSRSRPAAAANWNDIPEDFLAPRGSQVGKARSPSRGRRKGD